MYPSDTCETHAFFCQLCHVRPRIIIWFHLSSSIHLSIYLQFVYSYIHRYSSTHIILPELSVLSSNCVPPVSRMQGEPARFEAQKESAGCEQEFFFHGWNLGCWPGKSDAFPRKSASFRNDSNDFKVGDFKPCKKIKQGGPENPKARRHTARFS